MPHDPGCISSPTPARLGCLCWGNKLKPSCSHSSSSRAIFPMKPNTPQLLAPLCTFQRYLQRLYPSPKMLIDFGCHPPMCFCLDRRVTVSAPEAACLATLTAEQQGTGDHIHMKQKPVFFWFCSIFSGSGHSCIFIFLAVYLYL